VGRQRGAEHGLAGEVEVAGVLQHGAGDDLVDRGAREPEPGHQPVDGGGQQVHVGRLRVRAAGLDEGVRLPPTTTAVR
jgi:hypothetical protein